VIPSGANPAHYEVFSINTVTGWIQGTSKQTIYRPFISFDRRANREDQGESFYRTRIRPSVTGEENEMRISFVSASDRPQIPDVETISIDMTCTNRHLPGKLRIGDVKILTGNSPEYASFQNILPFTRSIPPPLEGNLHWLLISNMALNYTSLANVDALKVILSAYNFPAFVDRQAARVNELRMEGIESIRVDPITLMFRGLPARGLRTTLGMKSGKFSNSGDMYLFATVLNEFFSLYASINSFNQLTVRDIERGEEYQWTPRIGQQPII
jgi:type VI secretion system protein ImpG